MLFLEGGVEPTISEAGILILQAATLFVICSRILYQVMAGKIRRYKRSRRQSRSTLEGSDSEMDNGTPGLYAGWTLPKCVMCTNPGLLPCSECYIVTYCSGACRDADFWSHEKMCYGWTRFREMSARAPRCATSRAGIFFPAWDETPRFVWVPTEWVPPKDEDTPGYEKINLKPYLGDGEPHSIPIVANSLRSRGNTEYQIELFYRPDAATDGSRRSLSVDHVTNTSRLFYPWCGSMLAMKSPIPPTSCPEKMYTNMNIVDFRDIVDLFISYESGFDMNDTTLDTCHEGPYSAVAEVLLARSEWYDWTQADRIHFEMNSWKYDVPCVPGVRINCGVGGLIGRGAPQYEPVAVPIDDPIWDESAAPTIVSELVGFPVRTRRIRRISDADDANLEATFLHVDARYTSKNWGKPFPPHWNMRAGNVLVVHHERIPIIPIQVERLCSFCMDFLQPCIEQSLQVPANTELREEIFRCLVTPSTFQHFCSVFDSVGGRSPHLMKSRRKPGTSIHRNLMLRKMLRLKHWKPDE